MSSGSSSATGPAAAAALAVAAGPLRTFSRCFRLEDDDQSRHERFIGGRRWNNWSKSVVRHEQRDSQADREKKRHRQSKSAKSSSCMAHRGPTGPTGLHPVQRRLSLWHLRVTHDGHSIQGRRANESRADLEVTGVHVERVVVVVHRWTPVHVWHQSVPTDQQVIRSRVEDTVTHHCHPLDGHQWINALDGRCTNGQRGPYSPHHHVHVVHRYPRLRLSHRDVCCQNHDLEPTPERHVPDSCLPILLHYYNRSSVWSTVPGFCAHDLILITSVGSTSSCARK